VGPRKTSMARSSCHTKKTLYFDPLLHLIRRGGEFMQREIGALSLDELSSPGTEQIPAPVKLLQRRV
jgi:hypothetical protein